MVPMSAFRLAQVAPASALVFVLGFFGLAAHGAARSAGVYVVILAGSAAFAATVLGMTALFAAIESLSGRAWALGFRRLAPGEVTARGIAERALRYATFLWLCNGAAFFLAGFR
jgi:hypothetical protein